MQDKAKNAIVLFDLDGTLVDSTQAIYASFCEAYKSMGKVAPSREEVIKTIGHTLENMFMQNGVLHTEVDEYVRHYRICYRTLMEAGTHLIPHAKEAVIEAYDFAYLGDVTTKRGDFSQILLEKLGVWQYFDGIIGIESVSRPKPDAEPILKMLEHLRVAQRGIAQDRIFMVGDTSLDICAAKNAQIQSVGVLCGFGDRKSLEAQNALICENALEAVRYIAQKCSI